MTEKPRKRRHGDRRDGIWLRDLDPMHGFTPYLYPNRADNEAFIEEEIDLTNIDRYIAEKNAQNPAMITMTLRALSVWNFPSRKAVTSAMGMEAAKPSEAMDPPDTPACA